MKRSRKLRLTGGKSKPGHGHGHGHEHGHEPETDSSSSGSGSGSELSNTMVTFLTHMAQVCLSLFMMMITQIEELAGINLSDSEQTNSRLKNIIATLKNEEFAREMGEVVQRYTLTFMDILDVAKPGLEKLFAELVEIGGDNVSSILNTGIAVGTDAISSIPVIGSGFSVLMLFLSIFNMFVKIAESFFKISTNGVQFLNDTLAKLGLAKQTVEGSQEHVEGEGSSKFSNLFANAKKHANTAFSMGKNFITDPNTKEKLNQHLGNLYSFGNQQFSKAKEFATNPENVNKFKEHVGNVSNKINEGVNKASVFSKALLTGPPKPKRTFLQRVNPFAKKPKKPTLNDRIQHAYKMANDKEYYEQITNPKVEPSTFSKVKSAVGNTASKIGSLGTSAVSKAKGLGTSLKNAVTFKKKPEPQAEVPIGGRRTRKRRYRKN